MRLRAPTRRKARVGAGLSAGLLVLASGLVGAAPAAAQGLDATSVGVTVLSVSPSTPAAANTPQPLTITLQLTNTSDETLNGLVVTADRGNPITTQTELDQAIAKPTAPDPGLDSPVKDTTTNGPLSVGAALTASGTATVTLATTSSLQTDKGLCICATAAIYPLWFTVSYTDPAGTRTTVGTGQTFVPAFDQTPQPVQVSWLWPIIEAPHRLIGETTFTDDELATSVATGRLARVLQVADAVTAASVPMTLEVDPETIDELVVMSTGKYSVQRNGRVVAGTGGPAAAAWLATLRAILQRPDVELEYTAPGDPDVESLTANGLSWNAALTAAEQAEVATALGEAGRSDIAWPYGETLDSAALAAVVSAGAKTVVLNDASLSGGATGSRPTNALAPLQTAAGPVVAAVTSAPIERYVASVLSGPAGAANLPALVAEVAIRAVESPNQSHLVVITPPRSVDPTVPQLAAQAILDTARTTWSTPLGLGAATAAVTPVAHGTLAASAGGSGGLPAQVVSAIKRVAVLQPALTGLVVTAAEAKSRLGWIPNAVQRLSSSAGRTDPNTGIARAATVLRQLAAIEAGVYIVVPSSRNYTLGSSSSPLPLTIENDLPYQVLVRVQVRTTNGAPGFTASEPNPIRIDAHSKRTLRLATHVQRAGRFSVEAVLLTPNETQLGTPVKLSIHSTALGAIGIIITIVAGAVLVLALLVRLWLRLRARGTPTGPPTDRVPALTP